MAIGDTGLLKLQVKTSQLGDGFLRFATCSHTGKQQKDYRGQVDAFGVYSPELHLVYLVPVDEVPYDGVPPSNRTTTEQPVVQGPLGSRLLGRAAVSDDSVDLGSSDG